MEKLNLTKYKTLKDITFPLYGITPNYIRIYEDNKVLYIITESGEYILDNKNLPGDTLGKRRLRINSINKYVPRTTVSNISQLVRSKYKTFIDNNGDVFNYVRTSTAKLKYYRVKEIIRLEKGCVIILRGIEYPIKMNCRDAYAIDCVGILHSQIGYILYEISGESKSDTWRKI